MRPMAGDGLNPERLQRLQALTDAALAHLDLDRLLAALLLRTRELLVGTETVGVLHVGALRHRVFAAEEVELLQLAADRAAIAIEHARLFDAEKRARVRIEQVQAVTDAALAYLELEELLAVLLPRI